QRAADRVGPRRVLAETDRVPVRIVGPIINCGAGHTIVVCGDCNIPASRYGRPICRLGTCARTIDDDCWLAALDEACAILFGHGLPRPNRTDAQAVIAVG